ncbi:lycopene cyclase family protein [Persicitalea jodogahamensis]|uniref:Lycopene cyclase n=1 Tax=Persicitalea jodogahamensis TaxID=402147 RepID=A0A8J3D3N7_9BACT|nr:lycopene cyclase family protein [Persicitalea jodogahamensis]GHB69049.1 lycopene cyclase [Persicitalea jodogahamensis]
MKRYDYIIAGGGLAGLSLAYYMNQSVLRNKNILIIDKDGKDKNDRTWCFWETDVKSPFDPIIFRKWPEVYFYGSGGFEKKLDLGDYAYKWIRGIDFYDFVKTDLAANPNITFLHTHIERLTSTADGGFVITEAGQFIADYVFDSVTPLRLDNEKRENMLQHFKGWEITTPQPVFDPNVPIMMDYRVAQAGLGVRFSYVLPIDEKRAFVEYTVFSDKLLAPADYDRELHTYLRDILGVEDFTIHHEEFGVIPMTDEVPETSRDSQVIRIGTSGGYVKASSGYAFKRTQWFTQDLVRQLLTAGKPSPPKETLRSWFKRLLDSTLLNVLLNERHSGKDIFTRLYRKSPTPVLLAFLDGKNSLWDDLRIMSTVPLWAFTKGMVHTLIKRF